MQWRPSPLFPLSDATGQMVIRQQHSRVTESTHTACCAEAAENLPVASLRLVSPCAVADGVTLFYLEKVMTFFGHRHQKG